MPATFSISQDRTYIIETFDGEQTPEMQRESVVALIALMERTQITQVLLNARAQRAPLSTIDAYTIWNEYALLIPRGTRLAVIVSWELKSPTFTETVAVNRGVNVRYFNHEDQALEWLKATRGG
jgi:hypothetical protein